MPTIKAKYYDDDKKWRWSIGSASVTIFGKHGYRNQQSALKAGVQWGKKHNLLPFDIDWKELV